METRAYNVYTFEELTPEGQRKALEHYYDINVDHEWWLSIYDEAEELGFKIIEFDLGQESYCKIKPLIAPRQIALNILEQHGHHCETWYTAKAFLFSIHYWKKKKRWKDDETRESENKDFLHLLSEDYRIMLLHEYEYLTSEETIKESLIAKDYLFTEDGLID